MTNNITSIHDVIRKGQKTRDEMHALATGQVMHLRRTAAQTEAQGRMNESRATAKRRLEEVLRQVYTLYAAEDASNVVSKAHEEVRRSKGVQS
jgi:hypothetical protein